MNNIDAIATEPQVTKTIEQYLVEEDANEGKYKNTISKVHIADVLTCVGGNKNTKLPNYNDFKITQLSAALTGLTIVGARRSYSLGVDLFLRDDENEVYVLKNGLLCTGVDKYEENVTELLRLVDTDPDDELKFDENDVD